MIYISAQCAYDRTYGVTKLNKILWWSDIRSFGLLGRPITGSAYKRLPQGPVPDGLDELRSEMETMGEIAMSPQESYGRTRYRLVPLRKYDLGAFTGDEIAIVDEVIRENVGRTAAGVSRRSHGRMWEALPHLAKMPYESVFISDAKPTRYDIARTKELNRQFGWE